MDLTFYSDPDAMQRIPGLFRRWELAEVLVPGRSYRIECAGAADDDTPLFAVYAAEGSMTDAAEGGK